MTAKTSSLKAQRALEALGANIKTSRLKRRISVKDFADRIGASESTVSRLEKGDGGVSISTLAMACLVLGEIDRITNFLDAGTDNLGLVLEKEALPKRIDRKRKPGSRPSSNAPSSSRDDAGEEEGVAF